MIFFKVNTCFRNRITALIMLSSTCAFSQDLKLAGVEFFSYPKSRIENANANMEVSFKEYSAFVNIPIKFTNNKTMTINSLRYSTIQTTLYNSPFVTAGEVEKSLYKLSYSLIVVQKLNNDWTIIAGLTPTLASDFERKFSLDDLILQWNALVSKQISLDFLIGGGLIYSTQLGKPMLLPALQLKYSKNKHLITALLPSYLNYYYQADSKEKLKIGFRIAPNGANFNVQTQDLSGFIPAPINKLIYSRANVGPVISYQLTKILQIEAFGGISSNRRYRLQDDNGSLYNYDSKKAVFFNIGLSITQPKKNP